MDFDGAIRAHSAWKLKLSQYISKPDGSLNPSEIQKDHQCDLGKWIFGEGSKFSKFPEYEKLKSEHAKFHQCAAEVVKKADSGQSVSEEVALGSKSQFAVASNAVITAIMAMRRKAQP